MRVQIGLKASRIALPGGGGFYVEMKKLGGPGRLQYGDIMGAGVAARARFAWDRVIEGYRLPAIDDDGDTSVLKWPVAMSERDGTALPGEVFEGLDEEMCLWLMCAFDARHELLRPEPLVLARWLVQEGVEAMPAGVVAALSGAAAVDPEILAQAREALQDAEPTMGETLGNLGPSCGGNLRLDDSPTPEADTPAPET